MNAYKLIPNYTYEDYCQWQGNWEVIDGIAYAMSPMSNPRHQNLANELGAFFSNNLKINGCKCKVYQAIDVIINENTIVCPDVLIVCEPITNKFLNFPADLVVEIFSPSTKLKDQNTKFELYQNFGIKYYVMVDPETEEIFVYQLVNGKYQKLNSDNEFLFLENGCKISANMSEIFIES
jgi:Uma2 family endonuclease